jgi:hypothetical protein
VTTGPKAATLSDTIGAAKPRLSDRRARHRRTTLPDQNCHTVNDPSSDQSRAGGWSNLVQARGRSEPAPQAIHGPTAGLLDVEPRHLAPRLMAHRPRRPAGRGGSAPPPPHRPPGGRGRAGTRTSVPATSGRRACSVSGWGREEPGPFPLTSTSPRVPRTVRWRARPARRPWSTAIAGCGCGLSAP